MPANSVGVRVHDVWLVNAAVNPEAELVVADAAAPIRLRRHAHGAHGDGTESLFRLVLLDGIANRELRTTDRCLLVEPVGRARQTNATGPRRSAWRKAETRRDQCHHCDAHRPNHSECPS